MPRVEVCSKKLPNFPYFFRINFKKHCNINIRKQLDYEDEKKHDLKVCNNPE